MRRKREAGQSGGRGRRSPSSILLMTSSFLIPTNGFTPRISISQQHTPVRTKMERGEGGKRRGREEEREEEEEEGEEEEEREEEEREEDI